MMRDHLKALAEVARRYEIMLLSDEIYGEVQHDGSHISISRFYPERTIISGGISGWCGAGGWCLGTFVFPKELFWLMEPIVTTVSETYTSTSAPIQHAAISAYDDSPRATGVPCAEPSDSRSLWLLGGESLAGG
ncbi:MAG: aminotransferase class I/II-fold pyridoxal phosphate-dependent enzyme [Myxococcales bacterium]|nr:aminotransferase class I/II-fold pyridoxal phosphate-dependent enzyme [Myxococcales bacterium]